MASFGSANLNSLRWKTVKWTFIYWLHLCHYILGKSIFTNHHAPRGHNKKVTGKRRKKLMCKKLYSKKTEHESFISFLPFTSHHLKVELYMGMRQNVYGGKSRGKNVTLMLYFSWQRSYFIAFCYYNFNEMMKIVGFAGVPAICDWVWSVFFSKKVSSSDDVKQMWWWQKHKKFSVNYKFMT